MKFLPINKINQYLLFGLTLFAKCGPVYAMDLPPADPVMTQVSHMQDQWAVIKYQTPDKSAQKQALAELEKQAEDAVNTYPDRAEPKIWEGIILATDAGIDKGMSALPKVKKAKALFEQALAIDHGALDGSAHTSLGSLYYQVPGWPIAFGDDKLAKQQLEMAIQMNPTGIDANYFYGDFLIHEKQYPQAIAALKTALQAAPRPGREVADAGRRKEIEADLEIADKYISSKNRNN